MFSSSHAFSIHLPSNTKPAADNRTNRFTVRLPKKLEFGGAWMVGLSAINYPRSWRTLGTFTDQRFEIVWTLKNRPTRTTRHPLPSVTLESAVHLADLFRAELLRFSLSGEWDKDKVFAGVVRKVTDLVRINYDPVACRFRVIFDSEHIESIVLSPQLAFIMGFAKPQLFLNTVADYEPDLSGDISILYVYAPGLIEPVMVGNSTTPLLRVVNAGTGGGLRGGLVERLYENVEYHRLLSRELHEISIEIRTANGELVPFQYGNCLVSLSFRKVPLL